MSLHRQAKILSDAQQRAMLNHVAQSSRHPARDRVRLLLSFKAGMRAIEIASVTWGMVTDAEGQVAQEIRLENVASKGRTGGRVIPMHPDLATALTAWKDSQTVGLIRPDWPVISSERGRGFSANTTVQWFTRLYHELGIAGASSHSGRRTFATNVARKVTTVGGSLRDLQDLLGHASIQTTQRYVDVSADAKRRVVGLL